MAEAESVEQQDLFEHHRFLVDPGQSLLRIDKYLSDRMEKTSFESHINNEDSWRETD